MTHRDVLKSFLHRTAVNASSTSAQILRSRWGQQLQHRLAGIYPFRITVTERDLGRAVSQAPAIAAATVRIHPHGISLQVEDHEGQPHMFELQPAGALFAPRGAKELAFTVLPQEALAKGQTLDICAAIAGEIARALWRPVLKATTQGSSYHAQIHRVGDRVIADLRSIPEVRRAQAHPLTANVIDTISLADLRLQEGRIILNVALPSL